MRIMTACSMRYSKSRQFDTIASIFPADQTRFP
jgi:hypothetical protein